MKVFNQIGSWYIDKGLLEPIQKHSANCLLHRRTQYLKEVAPVFVEQNVCSILQILVAAKEIFQLDAELLDLAEIYLYTLHISEITI